MQQHKFNSYKAAYSRLISPVMTINTGPYVKLRGITLFVKIHASIKSFTRERANDSGISSRKFTRHNRRKIYLPAPKTFASLTDPPTSSFLLFPPPPSALSTNYIVLITDRTDNYRWIRLPALKASCEVPRQPLRGFTWKRREKSAGFRRAMPKAGLPAALRGNFVAARNRRR